MSMHRIDPAINYNEVDLDQEEDIYIGQNIIISTMYIRQSVDESSKGFRVYSLRNNKKVGVSLLNFSQGDDYIPLYYFHFYLNKNEIKELIEALNKNNKEIWKTLIRKSNDFLLENTDSISLTKEICQIPDYSKLPTRRNMIKYFGLYKKSKLLNDVGELETIYIGDKLDLFFYFSKSDPNIIVFKHKINKYPTQYVRISTSTPEYVFSGYHDELFSKEELKEFIDILNSRRTNTASYCTSLKCYPYTIWEQFKSKYNYEAEMEGDSIKMIPKDLPMPDYTLLPVRD